MRAGVAPNGPRGVGVTDLSLRQHPQRCSRRAPGALRHPPSQAALSEGDVGERATASTATLETTPARSRGAASTGSQADAAADGSYAQSLSGTESGAAPRAVSSDERGPLLRRPTPSTAAGLPAGQAAVRPPPAATPSRTNDKRRVATLRSRGEVAQLVEHTAENRGVAGSSPALAIHPCEARERSSWAERSSSFTTGPTQPFGLRRRLRRCGSGFVPYRLGGHVRERASGPG